MFYEDLFDLDKEEDERYKKYASRFTSIFDLKKEKKFYKLYSAITECHVIMIKNQKRRSMELQLQKKEKN